MFNLQGSEVIIILLLALVVLGPEKLPDAMRRAGKMYAELKKMSTGFQAEFRAAVDEPLRELRDTAQSIRDSADFTKLQSGERPEKPKSADMLAPADPEVAPSTDLPFAPRADAEPIADGGHDPVVVPPSEQAPFSSVIISGGSPTATEAAVDAETPAETPKPKPFSDIVFSSAAPPNLRRQASAEPAAPIELAVSTADGEGEPGVPAVDEPGESAVGDVASVPPDAEPEHPMVGDDAPHGDIDTARGRHE